MYTCEIIKCGGEWASITKIMISSLYTCQFYPGELPTKAITNSESVYCEDTEKYPF